MNKVTIDYYGMAGTGRNVTEAKRDAGEQIRKALDGDFTPSLIHWREYTVLVAREPKFGCGYRISHRKDGEIRERMYLNHQDGDEHEVLVRLCHHIGDIARPFDEDPALTRPLFDALIRPYREAEREFAKFVDTAKRNYTFQARYRHAERVLGMQTNDAHNWAGMNPCSRELWQGTEGMFTVVPWENAQ